MNTTSTILIVYGIGMVKADAHPLAVNTEMVGTMLWIIFSRMEKDIVHIGEALMNNDFISREEVVNIIKSIDTNILPWGSVFDCVNKMKADIIIKLNKLPSATLNQTAKVITEDNISICDNCSWVIYTGMKYCPSCGKKLEWE